MTTSDFKEVTVEKHDGDIVVRWEKPEGTYEWPAQVFVREALKMLVELDRARDCRASSHLFLLHTEDKCLKKRVEGPPEIF